jgi:predicted anti-sigma-YlaC factor YlaD
MRTMGANRRLRTTSEEMEARFRMTTRFPTSDCVQAREAASARLDGEITEFDAAFLETHLETCDACRALVVGFMDTTWLIRETPMEEPECSLTLPRRSSRPRSLQLRTAVAASAILAAGSFSLVQAFHQHSAASHTAVTVIPATSEHLLALLPGSRLSAPHMVRLGRNLPV